MHLHNDHIIYNFALHVLIICLDVAFIKTCVNTCTTSEPQIDYYMFVPIAHLYPLDVLV